MSERSAGSADAADAASSPGAHGGAPGEAPDGAPAGVPPTTNGPYLGLIGVFNAIFAAFLWLAARSGRTLPDRAALDEVLLVGVATYRLSRLLTKAEVARPLRAPFSRVEEKGGPGELEEAPRGTGLRRAIGKLITCPYCIGVWVAAFFNYGLVLWPTPTRLIARIFAAVALADLLHPVYVRLTDVSRDPA